jgi:hypothetical protein
MWAGLDRGGAMAKDGKSRDVNHEIDQRAEAILMFNVPPAWIPNPMRKDYGKDILFELIDEKTRFLKGTSFYVQLKGKKKAAIKDKGRYVTCSLEVPNIKDWCDKSPLPVFVVVVDITKERGWWLFIQEYMDNVSDGWRKQETFSVSIPIENSISNREKFEQAIEAAYKYVRIRGATASERLKFDAERLEELDPRFNVKTTATQDSTSYHLQQKPGEQVNVHFQIKSKNALQDHYAIVGQGKTVEFERDELEISGSPLVEHLLKSGNKIRLSGERTIDCVATCSLLDASGAVVSELTDIHGKLSGGTAEGSFSGSIPRSPLGIKLGPMGNVQITDFGLDMNFENWDRQDVRTLSYFDKIAKFLAGGEQAAVIRMEGLHDGNQQFVHHTRMIEKDTFLDIVGIVDCTRKLRELAIKLNVPIPYESKFVCADDFRSHVSVIYDFFQTGCGEAPYVMTTILKTPRLTESEAKNLCEPDSNDFMAHSVSIPTRLLSARIGLPNAAMEFHKAKFRSWKEDGINVLEISPLPGSFFRIRKQTEEEMRIADSTS